MGTKRGLVEHLIQIDLEGEADFRIYNQLPDKKHGFQKAVMPPIGAVDTEHGFGMAVAGANRIDNVATMRFVKKEDAEVPEFQMAGDQIPDIIGGKPLHALVGHRDRYGDVDTG